MASLSKGAFFTIFGFIKSSFTHHINTQNIFLNIPSPFNGFMKLFLRNSEECANRKDNVLVCERENLSSRPITFLISFNTLNKSFNLSAPAYSHGRLNDEPGDL